MGAHFKLMSAFILLPVFGCNMKGLHNSNSTGLEGDWTLSVPFSQTPGTINFSGNKFKETFDLGSGANAAELVITGDFTSDNKVLHLTNEEFQINKSVSFEAMTLRELIKKGLGTDYTMEWSGNNVLYLTSSVVGTGTQASVVVGLSRNGGQVDQKKVEASLEATPGGGGSASFDSNNGGTAENTSEQNNTSQANNTAPQQNSSPQDQAQGQSQLQGQIGTPSATDQNSQPQSQPAPTPSSSQSGGDSSAQQPSPQSPAAGSGQ